MAVLGYVYTMGRQTSRSPECCTSRNATSAEFLEVQIPPVSLCVTEIHRCPVSSSRSAQTFGGKIKKKKNNMKKCKWGNSGYDTFPSR